MGSLDGGLDYCTEIILPRIAAWKTLKETIYYSKFAKDHFFVQWFNAQNKSTEKRFFL